ncbi:MAG: class I SAM-dependent methyltransferase [Bacteroidetes bacterium]|nr:class I SAM-dependent methyltransferase [Bacteroidota bacterium]MBU1116171.1 class I SAM-dependent methyltransferase [Bacteroidota bacterium]MBU1798543.1 class I SAM-dependent methyltransferase [Bacteroidota bacterium]
MKDERTRICPVELANSLDSKIRRWLQNPKKILNPYVKEGMKVLDVGCGPGFFSIELAKMVGKSGKVFSVDLQEGMLQKISNKIKGTPLEGIINLIKCEQDKIIVPEKVDFILAFYMVHEVPNKEILFETLKNTLNEKGEFLIVEPKFFHVSQKEFDLTIEKAKAVGFKVTKGPKLPFSFSTILKNI